MTITESRPNRVWISWDSEGAITAIRLDNTIFVVDEGDAAGQNALDALFRDPQVQAKVIPLAQYLNALQGRHADAEDDEQMDLSEQASRRPATRGCTNV